MLVTEVYRYRTPGMKSGLTDYLSDLEGKRYMGHDIKQFLLDAGLHRDEEGLSSIEDNDSYFVFYEVHASSAYRLQVSLDAQGVFSKVSKASEGMAMQSFFLEVLVVATPL